MSDLLQSSIEWALPELRAEAEARMTSSCVITTPGAPAWDDSTGTYEPGTPTTIYSGKCRLRWPNPAPQDGNSGQTSWAVDRIATLSIPIDAPPVPDGAVATMTANPHDPSVVGMELTVLTPQGQSHGTARRLPVQIITRDEGYAPAVAPEVAP